MNPKANHLLYEANQEGSLRMSTLYMTSQNVTHCKTNFKHLEYCIQLHCLSYILIGYKSRQTSVSIIYSQSTLNQTHHYRTRLDMKLAVLLFCAMVAMAAAYSVGPPKSPKPTMQEEPLGECVLDYFSDSY